MIKTAGHLGVSLKPPFFIAAQTQYLFFHTL
jgi:hypothetical protein